MAGEVTPAWLMLLRSYTIDPNRPIVADRGDAVYLFLELDGRALAAATQLELQQAYRDGAGDHFDPIHNNINRGGPCSRN